jgi:UDP:flavonoid glycosyltransferase YjiC (YdhE family)
VRIVLSTWGSTGDVQPFLALARQLLKVGHEVRVCTSEIYRERFIKYAVDLYAVGVPYDFDYMHRAMDKVAKIKDPLRSAILLVKNGILYKADRWYQDCLKGMAGHDLAICHSADIAGQEAAIQQNLPWISVSYCPGFVKTTDEAPHPVPNLGKPFNALVWKFTEWLMRSQVDPLFNDFITSIGGKRRRLIGLDGMYSPELNLIAASPHINKPPRDFPKKHKFTGPWFLDEPDYDPPADLLSFLDRGSPPVIISFGSMGGTRSVETTRILVKAVQRTGQRAIIQAGWGNLGLDGAPESILFVGYIPHSFLFRQGCCVIHHGGAGTTAAACRAGVPSIIVPHISTDQSYWGLTLHKLGVAPKPLHRRDMTAKRLARRINVVSSSKPIAEKARTLGKKIEAEDGLRTAVELIEEFAASRDLGVH